MQINIEYNISYIYHSLYAFFDRDNIGLPGASVAECAITFWREYGPCLTCGAAPPSHHDSEMCLGLQCLRGPSTFETGGIAHDCMQQGPQRNKKSMPCLG